MTFYLRDETHGPEHNGRNRGGEVDIGARRSSIAGRGRSDISRTLAILHETIENALRAFLLLE